MKHVKTIVAIVMALLIAVIAPLQAAAKTGKYLSEVYVAYGKDAEEAKKTLQDKGFTPVEGNLNDDGDTYAMIGYKTTDNIRDAITDLAVMNMRGDYSVEDYKVLLKSQKTQIAEFLNEFMYTVQEYRMNFSEGKAKAIYAHNILNSYVDDDSGMKMGDLLNSETIQDRVGVAQSIEAENPDKLPDLITILLQGNAPIIKSIEATLSIAADTNDSTWLERFADTTYDDLLDKVDMERPELNTEAKRVQYLDNLYGSDAEVFAQASLELGEKLSDYEQLGLSITESTPEEIEQAFGDVDSDAEAAVAYKNWMMTGSIYEGLKNFEGGNFAKGELLDFFLDEIDLDDIETFITMAAAISDGQRYSLPFISFDQLMSYAFTSDEGWQELIDKKVLTDGDIAPISIYENIDRGIYADDGSVALTGAAQRANNTAEGTTGDKEAQMDTLSFITAVSWAATAGLMAATVAAFKVSKYFLHNAIYDAEMEMCNSILEAAVSSSGTDHESAYAMFRRMVDNNEHGFTMENVLKVDRARFTATLAGIIFVVTLVIAVATLVLTIIDLCRDKSVEQLPIPKYLVDNYTDEEGGSYSINYKAVECNREEYFGADYKKQKGSSADLMADEGKQWLALYASKNSKAGKPLTPDFIIQKSSSAPAGYEGSIHIIGEKGALNVASGAFRLYSTFSQTWQSITGDNTKYIFYKISNDVKTYDEASGNMTASSFSAGKAAIFGLGGAAVGAILGVVVTVLVKKKKKADS